MAAQMLDLNLGCGGRENKRTLRSGWTKRKEMGQPRMMSLFLAGCGSHGKPAVELEDTGEAGLGNV
jgi:hypothetical protein